MIIYHQTLDLLIPRFEKLNFTHLVRENNRFADSLATLSSMIDIPSGVRMRPVIIDQKFTPAYESISAIDEAQDDNPWYYDIWNFLEKEAYPQGQMPRIKRRSEEWLFSSSSAGVSCIGEVIWECISSV